MSSHWPHALLGEICTKVTDGSHNPPKGIEVSSFMMLSSKNVLNDQITLSAPRFLSESDFISENKRTEVQPGDVLLTIVGTVGRAAVVPPNFGNFTLQRSVAVLKPISEIVDSRFLMFALQDRVAALQAQSQGVAQKGIYLKALKALRFALPPLEEQKRIVALLDKAFAALDRALALTEANLADAEELFDNAKQKIFSKASAGAKTVTLGDVTSIETKLTDPRLAENLDLPHVGAGNMITGSDELIDIQTAREEKLKSGKFPFSDNVILYSKIRPYLRKVARPEFSGLCSADVYPLSCDDSLDRNYLFHLLLGGDFTEYAIAGSARAGMPKVNQTHLYAYKFSLPDLGLQKQVSATIDSMLLQIGELKGGLKVKLQDIDDLRQSLLQKAFAGELT